MKNNSLILLVEDDRVDAMTVQRAIKSLNIINPFMHVFNGLEALDCLANSIAPCIILLDLNMPKMNGIEFLAVLKKDQVLKRTPVVVLTTSGAERDKSECFSFGVAGYFIKPVDYKQFVEVIRQVVAYWTLSKTPR